MVLPADGNEAAEPIVADIDKLTRQQVCIAILDRYTEMKVKNRRFLWICECLLICKHFAAEEAACW